MHQSPTQIIFCTDLQILNKFIRPFTLIHVAIFFCPINVCSFYVKFVFTFPSLGLVRVEIPNY